MTKWPLYKPMCWGNTCHNVLCEKCSEIYQCEKCSLFMCCLECEYDLFCDKKSNNKELLCKDCCKCEEHE